MNRDCKIEELAYESSGGAKILRLCDLQDWLTDKKVIKKGQQPHPYADVWHEWAEDTEKVLELIGNAGIWYSPITTLNLEARIKPQEPVYEWQWMYKFKNGNEFLFTTYQTEEENSHFMSTIDKNSLGESSRKIEETKRERK